MNQAIELFEALRESIKPSDGELKKFLKTREGKIYITQLYEEKHPMALFFLSQLLKDERDNPFTITSGALRLDVFESSIDITIGNSDETYFDIKKGDKWVQLHVVEAEREYANLQPIERVKRFMHDLWDLTEKLRRTSNTDPQKGITYDMPIIGISHLVKLMELLAKRIDQQIIWDLATEDASVPDPVIGFFSMASSEISKKFGGKKANPDDVKVICTSANQLHTALQSLPQFKES